MHGSHEEVFNSPYRHGQLILFQCKFKERPCCNNGKPGNLLKKIGSVFEVYG
jgi:hypothetical protein